MCEYVHHYADYMAVAMWGLPCGLSALDVAYLAQDLFFAMFAR